MSSFSVKQTLHLVQKAFGSLVFLAGGFGVELAEEVFLLFGQAFGDLDLDADQQVALVSAADAGEALAFDAELGTGLGALGDVILDLAREGGDVDVRAQGGLGEGNRHVQQQGCAVPLEELVGTDGDGHVQVAGGAAVHAGAALAVQDDALAVGDAGGHLDVGRALDALDARAAAGGALVGDDFAGAAAGGAGPGDEHEAALGPDLAGALAGRAGLGLGAGLGAGAAAGGAGLLAVELKGLFAAHGRFLKGELELVLQVLACLGRVAALAVHAAHAAEELVENAPHAAQVAEAGKVEAAAGAPEGILLRAVHAELVVACPLFRVGQDLVGLVQLLEAGLGVFIVGMQIRVTFLGQLPVGLFDVFLGGVLRDAQHLVIISFRCCSQSSHL